MGPGVGFVRRRVPVEAKESLARSEKAETQREPLQARARRTTTPIDDRYDHHNKATGVTGKLAILAPTARPVLIDGAVAANVVHRIVKVVLSTSCSGGYSTIQLRAASIQLPTGGSKRGNRGRAVAPPPLCSCSGASGRWALVD